MEKISDSLTLHNGLKIPGLGFGVWQISPFHTAKCVKTAIKAGYRNIDTAEGYMNEEAVGVQSGAVGFRERNCSLPRNFGCRMRDMRRRKKHLKYPFPICSLIIWTCI